MSMLSLAGLVVSFRTLWIFSFLLAERSSFSDALIFFFLCQAFVISFSFGLGAIPWIIMSEVQSASSLLMITLIELLLCYVILF
jgi:hypothetical protein